ncbi:unnamed protein product [Bemisia tabaci]|uniref:Small ribosomal subunit protein mS33 n=1 Tax=Bemisia tabaci TaxID=7038 RepID=A0A9P0A3C4_BEMTA|nr:unnamed protein product [Bemisia tabaci]
MKHHLYQYKNLTKLTTPYASRITHLSNQIFGEVVRPTPRKAMKVVQLHSQLPVYKNPLFVAYYPRHVKMGWLIRKLREYGLFRDEHQDFTEEMRRLRELRGKVWVKGVKKEKKSTFL